MSVDLYLVGGAVRDRLLGVPTKDYDFTVIANGGWSEMRQWLLDNNFKIFVETPEMLTIRAHFPPGWTFNNEDVSKATGDFVLARKESTYSDGRHPDSVEPGTLKDDADRRDFTVNSLQMDKDGKIIDFHNGLADLRKNKLTAIGGAQRSFSDDALRVLRALRFALTKGFYLDDDIEEAFKSDWIAEKVEAISHERRQDELDKMLKYDSHTTLTWLAGLRPDLTAAILSGFRLTTTAKRK